MPAELKIQHAVDSNLNLLIGSGASFGLLPTLKVNLGADKGESHTIESLCTNFEESKKENLKTLLFMHYFEKCIKPAYELDFQNLVDDQTQVLKNYTKLITTIQRTLSRKRTTIKKCNVFTTNYDGAFEAAADMLLQSEGEDFIVHDGSKGFLKRFLHTRNYNNITQSTGIFEQRLSSIPQMNLIHLHGSVFWVKDDNNILVDYASTKDINSIEKLLYKNLSNFSLLLDSPAAKLADVMALSTPGIQIEEFWELYNELPIVNPTKWKFHETVFEQHYYQLLRFLSYELEKTGPILITFGFSFADEHILQLVQRALSNPFLQVFICCFNEQEKKHLESLFSGYENATLVALENDLDFEKFNDKVFNLDSITGISDDS